MVLASYSYPSHDIAPKVFSFNLLNRCTVRGILLRTRGGVDPSSPNPPLLGGLTKGGLRPPPTPSMDPTPPLTGPPPLQDGIRVFSGPVRMRVHHLVITDS